MEVHERKKTILALAGDYCSLTHRYITHLCGGICTSTIHLFNILKKPVDIPTNPIKNNLEESFTMVYL